jgi:hypothetical protein
MTKLQDLDFIIRHVGGETNGRANALSRSEGIDKIPAKVETVLSDCLFVRCLSGSFDSEDLEGKGRIIE